MQSRVILLNNFGVLALFGIISENKKDNMNNLNRKMSYQEIADFYGCSLKTAQRRIKEVQDYFGLGYKKGISLLHLVRYEGMPENDIEELCGK